MKEKFISILSEVSFFEEEDINFDLSLFNDLAMSSIMIVEMLASFEKEFQIELEREIDKIVSFASIGELYEFIKAKSSNEVLKKD